MTISYTPSKQEVADYYDHAIPLINRLAGVNVHLGYWLSDDDPSSVAEATDRLTDMVLHRLGVRPGDRVLDVGCGLGRPAVRLAERADVQVVGIATSKNLITEATALAAASGVGDRVVFDIADAADLPYRAGEFDAAFAIESIVHMPDRPVVYAELARVLRPGARIAVTDFYERTPLAGRRLDVVEAYRRFTMNSSFLKLEEYLGMLRAAGFVPSEFYDITERTARHHREVMAEVDRQRDELEALYGPEMIGRFFSVFEDCLAVGEPRNLLLAAELVPD